MLGVISKTVKHIDHLAIIFSASNLHILPQMFSASNVQILPQMYRSASNVQNLP